MERIAGPLLRRMYEGMYHSVIVEARPDALDEVLGIVSQIDLSRFARRRYFLEEAVPFGYWGPLRRFNMVSAILATRDIEWLANVRYVKKIYYDMPMRALAFPVVPADGIYEYKKTRFTTTYYTKMVIGAADANARGWTGDGVKVAVPDTGVAIYHEQLGLRHKSTNYESTMPFQPADSNGHGTWCCSAIGGARAEDEYLTQKTGRSVVAEGIAPDVELLCVKCLGYVIGTGSTSQIIKAVEISLDWGADIISMSLGGKCDASRPDDDPFYPVMEKAVKEGAIPVVAAGNSGPEPQTVSSPGCMPQVLTVGAYDPITGEVASFSSRGPTPWGDVKPDVIMPGVNILSASSGMLDAVDHVVDRYGILSGTSMATPHAAGMVALMKQVYNSMGVKLTVDEIKRMMETWATEHGIAKSNDHGWGPLTWEVVAWWVSTQYGYTV